MTCPVCHKDNYMQLFYCQPGSNDPNDLDWKVLSNSIKICKECNNIYADSLKRY